MKVLHILCELKPSGAEKMYLAAAQYWKSLGCTVHILSVGDEVGVLSSRFNEVGCVVHHIPMGRNLLHVFKVLNFIRRERYDVVHIDTEMGNFWYALSATITGVPVIVRSIHAIFRFEGLLRLRKIIERKISKIIGVRSISVSDTVRSHELAHFMNPSKRIYNWIEDSLFAIPSQGEKVLARAQLGIDEDKFVLTSVGNCGEIKNHSHVIRAVRKVPGDDFVYLHVGTGEDESREKDLADQLGVSKKIVFCGGGVNPRIALCASDAFIMPSLYEGFGCAALEAMYSAVPTILAKVPGLEEVGTLCDGVIWTDAEDASTTEAINRIRKMSTQERITLGDKLSESARRHFSMKLGAGEYLSVYTASDDEWKQSVERMS